MKIELLFAEVANLYGTKGDFDFLAQAFPQAEIIETQILTKPLFLEESVDFVYFGPMSEPNLELAIQQLKPYKEKIFNSIESGQPILAIGNAMEVFGEKIIDEDGSEIEALNLFPFYSKLEMLNRLSDIFLGDFEGIKIIGSKAQFSQVYKNGELDVFTKVEKGFGYNLESKEEGIYHKNFLATHILGPFLLSNPVFAKHYFAQACPGEDFTIPFEDLSIRAYEQRLKDLQDPAATS